MSDPQFTIADMISAARAESPSDFETAFNSLVVDRVVYVVDAAKQHVAQNYLSAEEESSEEENEESSDENTEANIGSEG